MTDNEKMHAQVAQNNVLLAVANLLVGLTLGSHDISSLTKRLLDTAGTLLKVNDQIIEDYGQPND